MQRRSASTHHPAAETELPVSGSPSTREAELAAALTSSRRVAGGLLLGMGGMTFVSAALPAWGIVTDSFFLQVLRSGARAGVVGGIADWFAVTALFRHPFGLPIPHTAILPRQQARLAQALGRFVATQFFTEQDVERALSNVDIGRLCGDALRQPGTLRSLTRSILRTFPSMLDRLEDGRASASIGKMLPVLLQGESTVPLMARALRAMVDSQLHQEVLSFLLDRLKQWVQKREPMLRSFIEARVREQGGRVVGWAIGASVASRVLTAFYIELDRIDPQDSELRESFTEWVRQEIDRLESDPKRRDAVSRAVVGFVAHDSLKAWSGELWQRLRALADNDLAREDGWSASVIETALLHLADQMASEPALRARISQGLSTSAVKLLPKFRDKLTGYIASVMGRWNPDELSERLELRVGKDLQYIRINGTIVGFLAGALLDVAMHLCFGHLG